MYCAYPVPGMGSNSLMYYYNGKSVSSLFGNVCVLDREELEEVCVLECIPLTVGLSDCPCVNDFCILFISR